jgi:hypothetical protein
VRAVDHEVVRRGLGVDGGDGGGQSRPGGQPAVRLDRERHGHRQTGRPRRPDDADRLADAGQGQCGDQIGPGLGEGLDLRRVVPRRIVGGGLRTGHVPVAARPDAAADQ